MELLNDSILIISLIIALLLTLLSVGTALYFYFRLKRNNAHTIQLESRLNELEHKVHPLQLEVLEARLNPHLFKNILNSIQSHAYQTYFAIDKLSGVLDYILYESRKRMVSPREEIDFTLNFIEVNKVKISPLFDLKIKVNIDKQNPLYEQELLSPLVTVDLIENAFKHADFQHPEAFISIVIVLKEQHFSITVANKISTKKPLKKEKSGLGLETLRQRMQIIYGDYFSLENHIEDEHIYVTHLNINLLEYKIKMLAAR